MEILRVAEPPDVPALQGLITRSGLGLSAPFYTPEQAAAVTQHVFGVDSQLIEDRTYLMIEDGGRPLACGGWSRRRTLFGGDQAKQGPDPMLDPLLEPSRIRAFFVEPGCERRGLATRLLDACLQAAWDAGFRAIELAATLPGEPFYQAHGFHVTRRMALDLPGGIEVPLALMRREL